MAKKHVMGKKTEGMRKGEKDKKKEKKKDLSPKKSEEGLRRHVEEGGLKVPGQSRNKK